MRFKVRVYVATAFSLFTQADHFEDYYFDAKEPLVQFAQSLARTGFAVDDNRKWIMPGAILTVEVIDE